MIAGVDYKEFVAGMLNPNSKLNAYDNHKLIHAVLGFCTELIEYEEAVEPDDVLSEAGDCYFYLSMIDLSQAEKDIEKIKAETISKFQSNNEVVVYLIDCLKKYIFQDRKAKLQEILNIFYYSKNDIENREYFNEMVAYNIKKLTKRHGGASFNGVKENERDS